MTDLYEIGVKELETKHWYLTRHLGPNVDIETEVIGLLEDMQRAHDYHMSCKLDEEGVMYYDEDCEIWEHILKGNFVVTVKKGSDLIHIFTFKLG